MPGSTGRNPAQWRCLNTPLLHFPLQTQFAHQSNRLILLTAVLNDSSAYFTSAADLSIITELALEAFENDAPLSAHALEVLPPVLATLQAMGVSAEASHIAEASDVFHGVAARICDHQWPATSIAAVLSHLRALPMSEQALAAAVRRGAARARSADLMELSAIVHQLLALAGPTCRDVALTVRALVLANSGC